jgi:HAD superfamily hydrolase (TIGR01662 family)
MGGLKGVLFDWDGTLVDSAAVSYRCYTRLFESFSIPFTKADFERTYSPDWHRTYREMDLDRDRWGEADERWLGYYREETTGLLPGARRGLERLAESGLRLGIVTSGDRRRVSHEIVRLGVETFLKIVVCGEDTPFRKPHPAGLLLALKHLRLSPKEAAYVGDSPEDIMMARAAGVFSIGIPGGFPNAAALRMAGPDRFGERLEEIVETLLQEGVASGMGSE